MLLSTETKKKKPSQDWYKIRKIKANLLEIHEPDHVSFFVLKNKDKALFIDSGLGLSQPLAKKLLKKIQVKEFSVVNTHSHCDHVGLNYLAKEVLVYRSEWTKFKRLKEHSYTRIYHELLKDVLPWPRTTKKVPEQKFWVPTRYIDLNKKIEFGNWSLIPFPAPGHTTGSLVFFEENSNILFLGDFIYNGILYLNLKDSSLDDFIQSVEWLSSFLKICKVKPMLLPSHNDIPLDPSYLFRLKKLLNQIKNKTIKPRGRWPFKRFFLPSQVFIKKDVRIVIRTDQLSSAGSE